MNIDTAAGITATFATIAVGQTFDNMGEKLTRAEFPVELAFLASLLSEKDAAKGFLSYWAIRTDGVGTLVVAMSTMVFTLI